MTSMTSGINELNIESTHEAQGQHAQRMQTVSLSGELSSPSGTLSLYGFHYLKVKDPSDLIVFSSSILALCSVYICYAMIVVGPQRTFSKKTFISPILASLSLFVEKLMTSLFEEQLEIRHPS